MSQRITGLEIEYGCLVQPPAQQHDVLPKIRDWLFENQRYGLIDLHPRGWDEPAGNGGFLFNGGRVYIDMGHLEYCTPECASALDVVRYDRAGDLLLLEALHALKLHNQVSFIRNNVDYHTGATFGCHENYSLDRTLAVTKKSWLALLAFLTLRVLFTGAGRLGSGRASLARGEPSSEEDPVPFQLSQRADFIVNDCFEWVQHNRAILNLRDEPLAETRFRRLHLIHGDTNVLPAALFLKVGTTRLVLDLLEAGELPPVALADPVASFRALSRVSSPPWRVIMGNGKTGDPIHLLRQYHERAVDLFHGRDAETDALLQLWDRVLDGLSDDPTSLVGTIDWVSKQFLLGAFCESEGLDWNDPWLKSQDLEFHQINPARSLGLALADHNGGLWEPVELERAKREPPLNSRAQARSRLMREIQHQRCSYHVDWAEVAGPNERLSLLPNPFQTCV